MVAETLLELLAVAAIGVTVGVAELVSRYRDNPASALRCPAACLYLALNIAACLGAFALIGIFDWHFGQAPDTAAARWTRVLIAGFGAMAVMRSSLFLLRVGDSDVGIGPAGVVEGMLAAADRGVDRRRGTARSQEVKELLSDVGWAQAREELPALCITLMQNSTAVEQETLARAVRELETGNLDEDVRVYLVGLALLNFAGPAVVRGAVALLKDAMAKAPQGE